MKAVLLAAGLGTRLGPVTESIPKCMVEVAGKPVLQHNIEWLRHQHVTDLAINLHHRPDVVRRFLGGGEAFGVTIHYSWERALLGTAGAVGRLQGWLGNEEFLVLYADNIISCDLEAVGRLHRSLTAILTVALFWRDDVSASGIAEVTAEGRIRKFIEKPRAHEAISHWVSAGLLYCDPQLLNFIPDEQFSDFGRDVIPAVLEAGCTVGGHQMSPSEKLHWIDTPHDLEATRAAMYSEGRPS